MTFLEKYMEDHASDGRGEGRIIIEDCPSDFGYESNDDGLCTEIADYRARCRDCWNREVPECES